MSLDLYHDAITSCVMFKANNRIKATDPFNLRFKVVL